MIDILKKEYPEDNYQYYSMDVVEGYDRPCFFTQILPLDMRPENLNSRKCEVVFYITIMLEIADEAMELDMIERIRELFGLYVKIGEKAIDVTDFDWSYSGTDRNVPEISVTLEWYERIEHKTDAQLIEQVITNQEMEE